MKRTNFPKRKEARKTQAEERNAAYSVLSPEEKLKRLDACQFKATKQRARLEAPKPAKQTKKSK